jgi:hypothetical protein
MTYSAFILSILEDTTLYSAQELAKIKIEIA